jgi:DNA-directed RNA polymerase specialized sigma subunit
MMLKGSQTMNRRKLYQRVTDLHQAGRTDHEIAEILGVTDSTVQYVASLYPADLAVEEIGRISQADQRPQLAYEMRHGGKSFGEISRMLNISKPKVHRIVHKYEWRLRRAKRRETIEH